MIRGTASSPMPAIRKASLRISARPPAEGNTRRVGGYVLADLSVRHELDAYQASLNVTNLFDKDYFATCDASVGCIRGAGREATLTLSRKF